MRSEEMMVLGLAALAVYFIVKGKGAAAPTNSKTAGATLISEYEGWKYYTNGTVISPEGDYYYQGVKVYDV